MLTLILTLFLCSLFPFFHKLLWGNEQRRNWGTYWSTNNSPAGQASELAFSFSSESSLHQLASGLKHFAPPAHTASPCFNLGRGIFQSGLLKEQQKMFMTADNMIMSLVWKSLPLWLYRYIFSLSSTGRRIPPWSPQTGGGGGGWLFFWDRLGGDGRWSTRAEQQHEWTTGRR